MEVLRFVRPTDPKAVQRFWKQFQEELGGSNRRQPPPFFNGQRP